MSRVLAHDLLGMIEFYQGDEYTGHDVTSVPENDNYDIDSCRMKMIPALLLLAFSSGDEKFRLFAEKILHTKEHSKLSSLFDEITSFTTMNYTS